jgi:CRP-like cAMP-binding protein
MIAYSLVIHQPVMTGWNSFFFSINAFQVIRIILERRDVTLSAELDYICKNVFPLMSKREFLKIWNTGDVREVTDERIVRQGEPQQHVYLIMDGKVSIKKENRELARLGKDHFFAEMSFLTNLHATADIGAVGTVKYNALDQNRLRSLQESDPELFIKFQSAVSRAQ